VRRGKRGPILLATLLAITVPIGISSLTGLILGYNKKRRPPGPLGRAMSQVTRLSADPTSDFTATDAPRSNVRTLAQPTHYGGFRMVSASMSGRWA